MRGVRTLTLLAVLQCGLLVSSCQSKGRSPCEGNECACTELGCLTCIDVAGDDRGLNCEAGDDCKPVDGDCWEGDCCLPGCVEDADGDFRGFFGNGFAPNCLGYDCDDADSECSIPGDSCCPTGTVSCSDTVFCIDNCEPPFGPCSQACVEVADSTAQD